MKHFFVIIGLALLWPAMVKGQQQFPQNWVGDWKGELLWHKTGRQPQRINMQLKIHSGDSSNTWSWQIIYGADSLDNRPYRLLAKDTANGHWVIDEGNGIVLDQFWLGNKLSGAFTVKQSTIFNSYYIEEDQLIVEFYSIQAKPIATTGREIEGSASVDSYKMNSYQKAILQRTH